MGNLKYVIGDATQPQGNGKKIIVHICNDMGGWGAGFVLALSNKWVDPEAHYRSLPEYNLGQAYFINVEDDIIVANMIAQHGVRPDINGKPPIRYDALKKALIRVNTIAEHLQATIHMPRIGSRLAGGNWNDIVKIIIENVHVPITVYDLQ